MIDAGFDLRPPAMIGQSLKGILLLLFLATIVAAAPRVWTDSQGGTMQAEFIRESDGEVSFLLEGKLITMRLDQLSESDQQIVRDLQAGSPAREEPVRPAPANVSPPAAANPSGESKLPKALRRKPIPIVTRTWTDAFGNQLTAKFVRVYDGNVVLSRQGRMTTVAFHTLTSDDQEYVRELLTSQGQEALLPSLRSSPFRDPNQSPPVDAVGPPIEVASVPFSQPEFASRMPETRKGPSAFFEELRQRDEERRQKHVQGFTDAQQQRLEAQSRLQQHQISANGSEQAQGPAESAADGSATSPAPQAPVNLQAQKLVILAIVIGGIVGTVSVIVFVAMTIASASSVAKQRQYR